ncbi:hypothetical protein Rhom172_2435 [Rhodothermus marinus SG0.5JP17-172]|nr:hypothetical protein Rhom172_0904 [Rhodothermus marinus SG0.5JP17-172]AEN74328.1 hypothetical protein Rhom172_2435 [Rhodothermus marinus SG0.5JP17-172]
MNISATLIANTKATHLTEPGQCPLHHPAVTAQALACVSTSTSNAYLDASLPERRTAFPEVISFVGMHLVRTLAGRPSRLLDPRNCIDQRLENHRVMPVGCRDHHRQRGAASVYHKMALCARFATIRWIRPGMRPLFAAGMLWASTAARLQSNWPPSPRRSSSTSWSRFQTPASFQSRRRRQQVMPLPQPSSWGSICQGMPLLSTKRMPVRTARSGIRGLPPRGLGGSGGKSGSMTAQSSSDTRGFAMLCEPRLLN